MKTNIIKYIFALVVIVLLVYSCYLVYGNRKEVEANEPTKTVSENVQKITNIRIPIVNFDTINPILSKNQNIQDIARLIYEPLLNINDKKQIELCLAKEWTKQNSTTYIIKLKEGIKWQDDNLLTADDVKFTIDCIKKYEEESIYYYQVMDITDVEVIDTNTIKIQLGKEIPFFEYNLTFPILSHKNFEEEKNLNIQKNMYPIGTGKFIVQNKNGKIMLLKNSNWWNIEEEPMQLTDIELIPYQNMGEVFNAFKIENIDLFITNSLTFEEYIGTIGYNKREFKGRELDYIAMNCNSKILSYKEVRKAISYLIPKEKIISNVYNNRYYISNFPLDNGSYLYNDGQVVNEYDVQKAIDILNEAGWKYSKNVWKKTENYKNINLEFNIVVNEDNEARVQVAEIISTELENFGINVNLKKVNLTQYKKYLENKNYDMIITGAYVGYSPDLYSYFGDDNIANYQNSEIIQLLNEAKEIGDDKEQEERYKKIIEIYNDEMPYIFLYFNKMTLVYSNKLMGQIDPNSYNIYTGMGEWYRQ